MTSLPEYILESPVKFLNGYVVDVSSVMGRDGGSSAIQLRIIEPNDASLVYPTSGTACIFTIGGLEFGGILQRRNYEESTSGYIWDFTLENASKVMDGVSVVLDGFEGYGYNAGNSTNIGSLSSPFTTEINNVWNPFAVRENYNYGGIFGGSNTNSFGFPAADLLTLLEEISRGEHDFGGKISYGQTLYTLDLTELKNIVPDNYRVDGPVRSLTTIISEITEVAGVSYLFTIDGSPNEYGIIEGDAIIKVKIMDNSDQPELGVIDTKITALKEDSKWIQSSSGRELTDAVTQKVVIGGQATRYWRASTNAGHIFPVWGKLRNNEYLISAPITKDILDTILIPVVLDSGEQYSCTPLEVWAAMAGREAWSAYKVMKGDTEIISNSNFTQSLVSKIESGEATPLDLYKTAARDRAYLTAVKENQRYQSIFNAVAAVGNDHWGKQFFVALPVEAGGISNNLKFTQDDKDYITSWEIAGSAWLEDTPISDVSFYDPDGKFKPTVTYSLGNTDVFDYSSFGTDYALGFGGITTFSGVSVDDNIYWRKDIYGNTTAMVLVTVPQVSYYSDETRLEDGLFQLAKLVFGINPDSEGAVFAKRMGYEGLKFSLPPLPVMPTQIGVAQQSTRYTYGPWYNSTQLNGKAELVQDTNLRPEVFGSTALMNEAAESVAYVANTNLGEIDNGVVSTTTLPEYSLADRFAGQGPYITSINAKVGNGGWTTEYSFNSYTLQGGKLAKFDYDRIANIRKGNIKNLKEIRDLYNLPPINKPFPRPPISRRVPDPSYNGFTLFMQRYNPFTKKRSGGGVSVPEATNSMKGEEGGEESFVQGVTTTTVPASSRKNPTKSDDDESVETKVVSDARDGNTGLFNKNHVFPTGKELNPNWGIPKPYRGATIADTPTDLNPDIQEPKEKINTLAQAYPTLVSGWGFDVNGLPVPAKTDGNGNPNGQFAENAGEDIALNKVGPFQMGWHKERQVWTPILPMVEGILTASIGAPSSPFNPNTQGRMKVLRGKGWHFDAEDIGGEAEEAVIVNRDPSLSVDIDDADGDVYVMCLEINYELRPIYVGCV